jgi:hypothetical protein
LISHHGGGDGQDVSHFSTCHPVVVFPGKECVCFIMGGYTGMFARRIQSLREAPPKTIENGVAVGKLNPHSLLLREIHGKNRP